MNSPDAHQRQAVVIPDTAALPWRKLPPAGLYSKTLSVDPETGARTALVRMIPAEDYVPPVTAHYHDTYEEILGVAGHFTFDAKVWLGLGSYVFHPPGTVHGFKSIVPEDSTILSRVGPGHTGNAIPEPSQMQMYSVYDVPDPRPPVAATYPSAGVTTIETPLLGTGLVEWQEISTAPSCQHGAAMVVLPAGWRSTARIAEATIEIFTLSPGLVFESVQDKESPSGAFVRIPAGAEVPAIGCGVEVRAFVTYGDI